ncbi:MAG TPA: MMPL family transporter [Polyangia bacterium]
MSFDALATFVWRRPRTVLLAAGLLFALALGLASRLELRTNAAELLPSKDPAVVELDRIARELDGTSVLQLAIESPDRAANLRLAAFLTARLRALGPDTIVSAAYDVRAEKKFFHDHRWLYAPLEDLEDLRDAIEREKNPLFVELDDSQTPEGILHRMEKKSSRLDLFPTGYFESSGGKLVVIVCRPPGGLFAEHAGERLERAARRFIAEAHIERYQPQMKVGLTGDVMSQLEERAALEHDLAFATLVCVTLVCLAVVLFFGRIGALPLLGVPALLGVAVAFAVAELAFGYLNASTAFLGSIVVGNGINAPIILLSRYEEERRAGARPEASWRVALAQAVRPTAIASLGAALAYGSLVFTRFRGFSQFGVIGATGMVAAWLAAVTVLPALLAVGDLRTTLIRSGAPGRTVASRLAHLATHRPRLCLGLFALLTVSAIVPLRAYLHDPFEYDLRNLRNRKSLESGAAKLAPRVDRIFGLTLTPSVVVADERAHTAEIRKVILDRDRRLPGRPLIGAIATVDDYLPGDLATQRKKLAVLAELRRFYDQHPPGDAKEKDRRSELRPPDDLRPITDADLPEAVRRPFTERDGTLGRIVLVYHGANVSVWDGKNLMRIADMIEEIPLEDGTVVRSSGQAVIFSAMIRSIVHDAPRATLASFLLVALLVLLLAGSTRGALLVLATLSAGVLWMLGAAAWLGVRTNFLDFIALPITFGIGVDYGINIWRRISLEPDLERAVAHTGGAVALCSLTTIIGYGALLVADNLALQSFGAMAILGELACLSAALIGLPAWLARRR